MYSIGHRLHLSKDIAYSSTSSGLITSSVSLASATTIFVTSIAFFSASLEIQPHSHNGGAPPFTIGLGGIGIYGWEKDVANSNYFLTGGACTIGGKFIISQTASIITENWVIIGKKYEIAGDLWSALWGGFIPAVVFRIAGSRFSWDIGATMPFILFWNNELSSYIIYWIFDDPIPIPILSFTYRIR